jgi:transcription antitermination factor NusB
MNRREAREIVFALIYEMDFHRDDDPAEVYQLAELCREFEGNEYIKEIYAGMPEKLDHIDMLINENIVGWTQSRLSKTSLAIMRLCVYEMLYVESVPFNIAINEAVELAKKFDHDKAPAFINGVVNAIADKENLK